MTAYADYTTGEPIADTKAPDGPDRRALGHPPVRGQAGQPGQPAQAHRHRRRHRPGRRLRRAPRSAEPGYNVEVRSATRTRPRRAHSIAAQGGINAAKNYQNDGDSRLPAVLRHRQGRRLPLPRVQRLPPRRVSASNIIDQCVAQGVPVRPRVRRPARQPLLRRRPGLAHLLRPRPDRPAAAARRLPGARAPGRRRHGRDVHPRTRCSSWSSSTARPAASSPATWSPARSRPTSPTPSCSPPAATATSSTCRPTRWAATSPRPGGRTARAPTSPTPATRRSTRPASRSPATTSRS